MATFADMGLLGDIFGGGTSALSEYLTPQQQESMQRQALLSTAAALLQAGGPSQCPSHWAKRLVQACRLVHHPMAKPRRVRFSSC